MAFKLIVQNSKILLKSVANYIINATGIKDLFTGDSSIDSNGKINWTLQHYADTAANFTSANPTLLVGQIGIETDNLLTTPKFKIGDGSNDWNTLPYANSTSGGTWGTITGTLSNQTDLQTALNAKEDTANKSTNLNTDQASNTKYPSVKAVYDWATGLLALKSNTTLSTYLEVPEQSKPSTPTNAFRLYADTSNRLSWIGENGYVRTFDGTSNTADRVYTLPDVAGSIMVGANNLSDLTNVNTARNNLKEWDLIITTGNQSTTSNVATNITGLVSPTLTANKRYRIHGVIKVGCNNTGGIRFQITLPSGASMDISLSGSNTSNTAYINATITSSATLSAQVQSFNGLSMLRVDGEISLGVTAGTIQFGFASGTNTQTSTVYQLGTHITLRQLD